MSQDTAKHYRTKHIEMKDMFVSYHVEQNNITTRWIPGELNTADVMTKPLDDKSFSRHRDNLLGTTENTIYKKAKKLNC